jgi:serine/threonine-protein kinase HipA
LNFAVDFNNEKNNTYNDKPVGRLALTPGNLCAFEYDPEYLKIEPSVSPFFLPLRSGLSVARLEPFFGN